MVKQKKLEIIKIKREVNGYCRRCGKKLRSIESIEVGMGKTCLKRYLAESHLKPLFQINKENLKDENN